MCILSLMGDIMETIIKNYTDKTIYELEKFQYVEYSSCSKYSNGAYSFVLATIPFPKYLKEIFISDDCIEIEYVENSNVAESELFTSDKLGKYTYCLGNEHFKPYEETLND